MADENWTLTIKPKRKLLDLQLRDVIRYRDLVYLFVKRDFVLQYKQTILGPLWLVIQPLFSTIMYSFVFGNLANIGTNGVPFLLFYYSGTMLWTFFAGCFSDASNLFINNANLFGKVYFPRLTVPISNVFSNVTKIFIQFLLLMVFYVYYIISGAPIRGSLWIFAFPLIFAWLAALGMGVGIIISSLTTKYRDLKQLVTFALGLAMYATPVVYPMSSIPSRFSWVNFVNPVSAPIELFRIWFYGAGSVSSAMILTSLGITVAMLFLGLVLFNQNEQNFIDVV
ncbi:ABC transporter, permease protein [Treponema primitia ZAS-2]|uniref:Transport permease protein n=2 Tax=Treponema primitia TaxID=88058 RepID=F5YHL0_TREPZ|nr:ABC transporter permease [Treponema primitia]AEF84641.1 ABC transporter, permease protein [Treponema primitia ZAS-2]